MTVDFKKLTVFSLKKGNHHSAEQGVCAMEAVAWLEGLPHSDKPECTCPVIAAYVRSINDSMPHDKRQRLVPYLPKLVGTVSKQHKQERAEFLAWQAIRVFAPIALRARGFEGKAKQLENFSGDLVNAAAVAVADADAAADAAAAAYAADAAAAAVVAAAAAAAAADAVADAAVASAAAYAADAADAAAAYAADAASAAAYAAAAYAVWDKAFQALDGVLAIGPQSPGFSTDTQQRVAEFRELIHA